MKIGIAAIAATLAIFTLLAGTVAADSAASVTTDKSEYQQGENVIITITNHCRGPLVLNGFWVENEKADRIYAPPQPLFPYTLKPGESVQYVWEQVDMNGNAVPAGAYAVFIDHDSAPITINAGDGIIVDTDKATYESGEPVEVILTNEGAEPVVLLGYWVEDAKGNVVYTPNMPMFVQYLQPGESIAYVWEQVDYQGDAVPLGSYTVNVQYNSVPIAIVEATKPQATVTTDRTTYGQGEPVVITITNTGSKAFVLTGYTIFDSEGAEVYAPAMLDFVKYLQPGESYEYVWEQVNNEGKAVQPGAYTVVMQLGSAAFDIVWDFEGTPVSHARAGPRLLGYII